MFTKDEKARRVYELAEKSRRDRMSMIHSAERRGREEGREEGVESEKIASIKKLMKNGNMSLEQAMTLLEIPSEEREQYVKRLE